MMSDYESDYLVRNLRLQEEIAELRKELAAEQALRKVKDAAIEARLSADKYCYQYSHLSEAQDECAQASQDADDLLKAALSQTSPTAALDAKIAEVEINVLEEVLHTDDVHLVYMIEKRKEEMK